MREGRYADAELLYKRALTIFKTALGSEHLAVARSEEEALHRFLGREVDVMPWSMRGMLLVIGIALYLGRRYSRRVAVSLSAARAKQEEEASAYESVEEQREVAAPTPAGSFRDRDDCPEMLVVPARSFTMREETSGPEHQVTIGYAFAIGLTPVTRDDYARFASETDANCDWLKPGFFCDGPDPVVNVSFDDAKAYVAWLSEKSGHTYRLPSESEWYRAIVVGSSPPNSFGLFDMGGNVWEWTEDCWNPSYDGAPNDGTAWTTGDCGQRVLRTGEWDMLADHLRSSGRGKTYSETRDFNIGFRVARAM